MVRSLALIAFECQYTGTAGVCQLPETRAGPEGSCQRASPWSGFPPARIAARLGRIPASPQKITADETVKVTVQHTRDIAPLDRRAVILHQGVGLQNVGADLTAKIDLLLRSLLHLPLLIPLATLELVKPRPQ